MSRLTFVWGRVRFYLSEHNKRKGFLMITIETKVGDTVTNWYGETKIVRGETERGFWWLLEDTTSGRVTLAHKITADTVFITGQEA